MADGVVRVAFEATEKSENRAFVAPITEIVQTMLKFEWITGDMQVSVEVELGKREIV